MAGRGSRCRTPSPEMLYNPYLPTLTSMVSRGEDPCRANTWNPLTLLNGHEVLKRTGMDGKSDSGLGLWCSET